MITHAQIQAAARAMFEAEQLARRRVTESYYRVLARIALTAAAEVGEEETVSWPLVRSLLIERCAQVAEEMKMASGRGSANYNAACNTIAAAIRALKDKP